MPRTTGARAAARRLPRGYGAQARVYDHEYRDATADVAFIQARLDEARVRGPLLELGCGTGRVAIPLALAGHRVTGIDISEAMLDAGRARRRRLPPEVAARLRFARKDMRDFAFPRRFSAVLAPFSALAMLTEPAERAACLARCRAALEPGGLLLIDLFAPRAAGVPTFRTSFRLPPRGLLVEKESSEVVDVTARLDHVTYHYKIRDPEGRLLDEIRVAFRLARVDRAEIETALYAAGFDAEEVWGDYRQRPYGPQSERLIVQARRLPDA
jgi:SAM-dependent methyltransferase